ncbi:MAG TPA: MaoC family dehydratase N-terminal domain-containing protein [Bdellovibrionota bacterium]|jgi:hypothetical protein|nr:MaoC family dehydratase N-terminal domain-containing protein [Bdellovibrionota bacterium]
MESLNLTREIVGRRYPARRNYLSDTWVRSFAQVVCPDSAGEIRDEVPEFFIPALRDGPFEIFNDLGVELKRLLHVSQEYAYSGALKINDWAESVSTISDLKEKSSKLGSIYILDVKTVFTQNQKTCVESLMRVFVRRS